MCLETMDIKTKHGQNDRLRKTKNPGPNKKWSLLCVSAAEDEALTRHPARAVKRTIRRYLRRQQRRVRLGELSAFLGELTRKDDGKVEEKEEGSPAAACLRRHPPGAMAPRNTTQYLMSNAYEDARLSADAAPDSHQPVALAYDGSLSPRAVYTALDTGYDSCLDFQQKQFEEEFGWCW